MNKSELCLGVFYPIEQQYEVQGKRQEESQEAQVVEVSGEVVLHRLNDLLFTYRLWINNHCSSNPTHHKFVPLGF